MTSSQDTGVALKPCPKDGIDVAIVAFLGRRLSGGTIEEAREDARAMLEFFGVPHDPRTPENDAAQNMSGPSHE